jgi:hypothetical protein
MTTEAPPPSDAAGEGAGDIEGDARGAAARLAAADAARLAAEVEAHEERLARLQAEARVRELEAALAEAVTDETDPPFDRNSLSLFDDPQPVDAPSLAADGSDPAVLPMALIGIAIVAGLAGLLAFFNDRTGFGIVMFGVTALLLWFASATWVTPVEVSVNRGIVYIDHGSTKHRFDLRNDRTQVEMSGEPGDRDWEVRFVRRGLDPFVIRDGMVDARSFVGRLREWRPDL